MPQVVVSKMYGFSSLIHFNNASNREGTVARSQVLIPGLVSDLSPLRGLLLNHSPQLQISSHFNQSAVAKVAKSSSFSPGVYLVPFCRPILRCGDLSAAVTRHGRQGWPPHPSELLAIERSGRNAAVLLLAG